MSQQEGLSNWTRQCILSQRFKLLYRLIFTLCLKKNWHLFVFVKRGPISIISRIRNPEETLQVNKFTLNGYKFVNLTWNMSPHYLVKCRTNIHWLFVTKLLRNVLFKQLKCELNISKDINQSLSISTVFLITLHESYTIFLIKSGWLWKEPVVRWLLTAGWCDVAAWTSHTRENKKTVMISAALLHCD